MLFENKAENRQKYLAAVLGAAGFIIVLIGTYKFGPGISHDSVAYIFASKSLLAGRGYEYFGYESPFVQWPPFFPTLLALGGIAGIDPVTISRYVNAVVFGLIVFLSGTWLGSHLKNKVLAGLGTVVILLGAPLIYASSYVWTEPFFVLFFLVFLFEFEKYFRKQQFSSLLIASAAVALACLDRYMGVTIVLAGCLLLLFQRKKIAERFADAFVFGFISSFPTMVWIARNYIVSSTLVGLRTPASATLFENIKRTVKTIISWLVPYRNFNDPLVFLQAAAAALVVLSLAALLLLVFSRRGYTEDARAGEWLRINRFSAVVLMLYAAIYIIWMIASATSVAFDPIGDRYMLPVYVPVFLLGLLLIDFAVYLAPKCTSRKIVEYVLLASLGLWLVNPAAGTIDALKSRNGQGMPNSLNSLEWRNSELILHLGEMEPEYVVYSNYPEAIYALTGIEAKYTPKKEGLPEFYGFEIFKQRINEAGGAYLAWFDKGSSRTVYNVEELKGYFDMDVIDTVKDGTLYFIKPNSIT